MAVSELPGNPNAVWTVKKRTDGEVNCKMLFFLHYLLMWKRLNSSLKSCTYVFCWCKMLKQVVLQVMTWIDPHQ